MSRASSDARYRQGPEALLGVRVADRFEVIDLVATGSMGRVYRAVQHPLGREVALKVLHVSEDLVVDADYAKRFLREASALARLSHPNTVRIFDFGIWKDLSYLVMELVQGTTLDREIRRGPMEPVRALRIARQVCASLQEAHERGIVHRDLKPGNILLTNHGDEADHVKVVDFGLVKDTTQPDDLAREGQIVGSPHYMAPEQIRGQEVDGRADLYALGIVLFKALTGRLPFPGREAAPVLLAHLQNPAPTLAAVRPELELPPVVSWTLQRCLAKKRDGRFSSAKELARALKAGQLAFFDPALWELDLTLNRGRVVLPPELTDISLSTSTTALEISDSLLPTRPLDARPEPRLPAPPPEPLIEPSSAPAPRGMMARAVPIMLGALLSIVLGLLLIQVLAPELLPLP
jgi:eukaryotic-like serine/threonine-protein kinase